ncbi:MAG: B12-binding domain-containing radical SAM protein [Eubacteriales bacterium]|nr:B12-binding domain-containing radical SAM protein [Eubacteriales bacterium]
MKILLGAVNAKYIHSNLAVYSLRASAGEYKKDILLKEYTINQQEDEILKDIWKSQPDLMFFSCYIWNISFVKQVICDIHKLLPDVPIWVGGPEVSYDAVAFLEENPQVTGVMKGEGEATFYDILSYYHGSDRYSCLADIPGIALRQEAGVTDNPWREILDLSTLPFSYADMEGFEHKIIYYESSRGCPFSCSYCLSSVDKKLRFRDTELVKKELQFFIDRKVPQVKFVDRTFNCSHKHAMEIWRYIKEHDLGMTNFHFEVAADLLSEEELNLIASMRPGLIQLEIGVQSTNPQTIEAIHRKMDFSKVAACVRKVQEKRNIHQHLDLIAGLPYEDYESFRRSFNDVYALQPEQLQLGFLKVLKGSYMHEMTVEYECQYKEKEPYEVLSTRWLPYGDILKLKQVESMVEVYYNSRQFSHTLPFLVEKFSCAFDFYQSLGAFYEEKGYEEISHSRMRRYEILLEFLREKTEITLEEVKKLLTIDLYERENLKSRPDWMSDQRPYQKEIREYIRLHKLPKTVHIEVFSQEALLFDYEKRDPLTNNTRGIKINLFCTE